ncbi:MAG: restriction endonuclease subunit S [Brevibacterium aurantiacum]
MSHIDDLIAELAPKGVCHVALSEVAEYSSTRIDAADLDAANFVGVDNLVANKGGRVDASYLPNTARLTAYEPGDILLGNIRPYLKKVWLATTNGGCSGDVLAIRIMRDRRDSLDFDFLYYLISSDDFFAYNMQNSKGAKMPRGNKSEIMKYRIPVPPLEVQREIVRILDQFTALEAELEAGLEAELEARRRQYEHYRDALFDDINHERWVPLSQIGRFQRGSSLQKKNLTDAGVPAFHYGQVYTHYGVSAVTTKSFVSQEFSLNKRCLNPGDVFIATTSENEEDLGKAVAWLGDEPAVASSDAYIYRSDADARFISHFFASEHFQLQKKKFVTGTKVKRLSGDSIGKIRIPFPSRSEQEIIADSLDRFETLVNDLSVGLPAELAARRKQYEYYRDKLLTFEEAPA